MDSLFIIIERYNIKAILKFKPQPIATGWGLNFIKG